MRLGGGAFDTASRYLRKVAVPSNKILSVTRGPAISVSTYTSGADLAFAWRWRVGSATQKGGDGGVLVAPDNFNTEIPIAL